MGDTFKRSDAGHNPSHSNTVIIVITEFIRSFTFQLPTESVEDLRLVHRFAASFEGIINRLPHPYRFGFILRVFPRESRMRSGQKVALLHEPGSGETGRHASGSEMS